MKMIPLESSAVIAAGFETKTRQMKVVFSSGRAYTYLDVPKDVFEELLRAKSKGRFMNENIIGIYDEYHDA